MPLRGQQEWPQSGMQTMKATVADAYAYGHCALRFGLLRQRTLLRRELWRHDRLRRHRDCRAGACLAGDALAAAVAVGELSALGATMTMIGIPHVKAILYETALKVDKYMLMVQGSANDVLNAHAVLAESTTAGTV